MKALWFLAPLALSLPTVVLGRACTQKYDMYTALTLPQESVDAACRDAERPLGDAAEFQYAVEVPTYNPYNGIQNGLDFTCYYEVTRPDGSTYMIDEPGRAVYTYHPGPVGVSNPLFQGLARYKYDDCQAKTRHCQGNPIDAMSGTKYETVVDYASPKDSRFRIERLYSSYEAQGHAANFGWADNWYSPLTAAFSGYAQFKRALQRPGGQVIHLEREQRQWQPVRKSTDLEITSTVQLAPYAPGQHTVHLGNGQKEIYTEYSRYDAELSERAWPDGYRQFLSYDQDGLLSEVSDSRGQIARFTWGQPVPQVRHKDVITAIEIDIAGGETAFEADIRIDYDIVGRFEDDKVLHVGSTTTDLSNGQILQNYGYSYMQSPGGTYSEAAKLIAITDGRLAADGTPITYATFEYGFGGAVATQHAGGVDRFEVRTDINGVVTVTNPLGRQTIFEKDTYQGVPHAGTITGEPINTCLGTAQTYSYLNPTTGQQEHYVYEQTERNGSITRFTRNDRGLVLTKTEDADGADARVTTYTWHADYRLPLTRITTQVSESFTYDVDGLLTEYSQTDVLVGSPNNGDVRTWTYGYTALASGLKVLTSVDGPGLAANGVVDVTTYAYNADGTLASMTDPNGLVTTYATYDNFGNVTRVVNPDDVAWSMTYDAEGQLIEVIENVDESAANKTTFEYDIVGQMTSYTTASGQVWTLTYDDARRLTGITNSVGEAMAFTHDAAGNVTSTEYRKSNGSLTFLENTAFDELNRIKDALGAQGQQTTFSYDEEDNLVSVVDAMNYGTSSSYDGLNRLVQVVDRAAGITQMDYDDADQVTQYTDPRQIDTGFAYNGFGEVVQETSADRGTMQYTYNLRGLVTSMTDGNGVVSTYDYDNGDRITHRRFPSDPSQDQSFEYDFSNASVNGKGKIFRINDSTGLTQRTYRSGGYVSLDRRRIEGKQYDNKYKVDNKGRLVQLDTASKLQIKYSYDTQDRIKQLTVQRRVIDAATNQYPPRFNVMRTITYHPFGPMYQFKYADGFIHRSHVDQSYRLTRQRDWLGSESLRDVSYSWTTRDNLSIVSDALDPLKTETYQYTPREFLAEAVGEYGEIDYTYDAVGNRTSRALYQNASTVTDIYAYPLTSNRLDSVTLGAGGTRSFTYDAAGNVTYDNRNGQGYGYTYNAANRMESFSINGVVQEEYLYNAMGQQVVRRMTQAGKTIHVTHDLDGNRLAEYEIDNATGARTLLQEYVWFDGAPVAVVDGQTDEVFLIRTDHIGRPIFATDINGVKVWDASYLPFGGVHVASTDAINLRFPGQWFHAESGLHQNWMRDYDPTTGRYMQADPLGLVDGASVYGYVRQNPGRYVDPTGELIPAVVWGGAAAAAGAALLQELWRNDGKLHCVNWLVVGGAGALGATGSSYVYGLAKGLGNLTKLKRAGSATRKFKDKTGHKDVRDGSIETNHALPIRWFGGRNQPSIGNHFMNLRNLPKDIHRRFTGKWKGQPKLNPVQKYFHGAPHWWHGATGSLGLGGLAELLDGSSCDCVN